MGSRLDQPLRGFAVCDERWVVDGLQPVGPSFTAGTDSSYSQAGPKPGSAVAADARSRLRPPQTAHGSLRRASAAPSCNRSARCPQTRPLRCPSERPAQGQCHAGGKYREQGRPVGVSRFTKGLPDGTKGLLTRFRRGLGIPFPGIIAESFTEDFPVELR